MRTIDTSVARVFFRDVSPNDIISGKIEYDCFPEKDFYALGKVELTRRSESEMEKLYCFWKKERRFGSKECVDVFSWLKDTVSKLVMIKENQPVCKYSEILEWRELIRTIGEDLGVSAFLAERSIGDGDLWEDFEWSPVIGHDNMQLNRIMKKGISDNHFHLFGSTPAFRLIWIRLMNDVTSTEIRTALAEIDNDRRTMFHQYNRKYNESSLNQMHYQAARIRLELFDYLKYALEQNGDNDYKIKNYEELKQGLLNDISFEKYCGELQSNINGKRLVAVTDNLENIIDYASLDYQSSSLYHDFAGERSLLYHMLLDTIGQEPVPKELLNLFYAYIVIKSRFYSELVQVNEIIGFHNFKQYNKRKGGFLFLESDEKRMVQHAVFSSFEKRNMISLELRISPRNTMCDNQQMIRMYDEYIGELDGRYIDKTYYVFHFPKTNDKWHLIDDEYDLLRCPCRHEQYREMLEEKTNELIKLRDLEPREAARILGVDACSQEIGCRPEVFACSFRRLADHIVKMPNIHGVKQWKLTYHVGEDFLEIADGLRAIDEAVEFFNMRNGDRIGHGTALGQDVRTWYEYKDNVIALPQQDHLDNIVWLYHKLIEYDISDSETLKDYLLGEYEKMFSIIYNDFLDKKFIEDIIEKVRKTKTPIDNINIHSADYPIFSIHTYYGAWKLRGDDPACYVNGYFEDSLIKFRKHNINSKYVSDEVRGRVETGILYYYYHYCPEVKRVGEKSYIFRVPDFYVDGVEKVQKCLQQEIAERGICVEANPSSNYLISTMQSYSEHPIHRLFNLGLALTAEELQECSQVHVSINTDDKGVFHTSLENEYALLARSMELVENESGSKKYTRQKVFDWINRIRENGNQQSFLDSIEREAI